MKNHNHSCLDRERILFITLIALTALLNTRRGLKFSLTVSKRFTSLVSSLFIQISFSASVAVGLSFGLSERHFCMNDLATHYLSIKARLYSFFFFYHFQTRSSNISNEIHIDHVLFHHIVLAESLLEMGDNRKG